MKHFNSAKRPTRRQKLQMSDAGLNPSDWLIVSATKDRLKVSRCGVVREIGGLKNVSWR